MAPAAAVQPSVAVPARSEAMREHVANAQALFGRIAASADVDNGLPAMASEICALFNAERVTVYGVSSDGNTLIAKVKSGLNGIRDFRLPINDRSLAGYCALTRKNLNIADAYDRQELEACSPGLRFLSSVDRRTGYRTREVLLAPIVDDREQLLGVVQILNHRGQARFPKYQETDLRAMTRALAQAMTRRTAASPPRIQTRYDDLVTMGAIAPEALESARREAKRRGTDIEQLLLEEHKVPLVSIGAALAAYFKVPYEPARPDRVKPVDLLRNLRREYVEVNRWLPVEEMTEGIMVIALDPEKVRSSLVVTHVFPGARIAWRVTTAHDFAQTVEQFYGAGADSSDVTELLDTMTDNDAEAPVEDAAAMASDNEVVKLVNKIIVDAYNQGASDIHVEPFPGKAKTLIRFRRDGTLLPYIEVPASYRNSLVTRIKIMCDLDISERRKPQDGKIKFKRFGPLDIELRVATLPSAGGVEDVVMRILAAGEPLPLDKLGLLPHNQQRLVEAVEKPYGLFFVCGPTGSGKTTTLHSILKHLNTPETKIWTAEDPVEITQKGLRQVQVNRKAGLDFATVMRAFLRADPDIIMVGEMRDKETVSLGIEASLTGHLVFATLHTNSAPESIIRLIDMGMDPFNFADALLGILAQRLAKRLCASCRQAYHPDETEIGRFLDEYTQELEHSRAFRDNRDAARARILAQWRTAYGDGEGRLSLYRPVGCKECSGGYRGRVGLHELLIGTDGARKLIQERARVADLLVQALDDGMRTLKMDGMEKALQGVTDLKQVRSVCIK